MAVDETCVARIQYLYVETDTPISQIAREAGLSRSQIHRLVAQNGWPKRNMRPWARSADRGAADTGSRKPKGGRKPASERDLVQRLYNAIDQTLSEIERPAGGAPARDGEYDKRTRAIASMVRSLEKVLEIKVNQAKVNDTSGGAAAEKVRIDAEHLRRDIAERLERLQRKRDAQGASQ